MPNNHAMHVTKIKFKVPFMHYGIPFAIRIMRCSVKLSRPLHVLGRNFVQTLNRI